MNFGKYLQKNSNYYRNIISGGVQVARTLKFKFKDRKYREVEQKL